MVYRLVQLCVAACTLAIPLVASADELFDEKAAKEISQALDAHACATGCEGKISGTAAKIELVDINFDKKGEYFVTLTESCGSDWLSWCDFHAPGKSMGQVGRGSWVAYTKF